MKKKTLLLGLLMLLSLLGAACSNQVKTNHPQQATKQAIAPTLYFHGLNGSVKNEAPLIKKAKKAGLSDCVIQARVDKQGKVTLRGKIKARAKNPIVAVNFADKSQVSFKKLGQYATNVVKKLQQHYSIKSMKMIGYSIGNLAIMYYVLQNYQDSKMPKLTKQVSLGGHYDGAEFKELPTNLRQPKGLKVNKNGKPNKMNQAYREMLKVRKYYQENPVKILNIYGKIEKMGDGVVSTASARSLKYLTSGSDYQEESFKVDHGSLVTSSQVIDRTIDFLWK